MKVKLLVAALAVLIIVNVAAIASFWFLHHKGGHSHGAARRAGENRWEERYSNLDDEERARLVRVVRSFREEVKPLSDQTGALQDQVITLMRENPAPRAEVDSLLMEISATRLEIARRATDRMISMSDSLTADERAHLTDALMRFRRWRNTDRDRTR